MVEIHLKKTMRNVTYVFVLILKYYRIRHGNDIGPKTDTQIRCLIMGIELILY